MVLNVQQSDNVEDAVLDSEKDGPVCIEIQPYYHGTGHDKEVRFRVTFEPDNPDRRVQPYRRNVEPVFPNGWEIGDAWDSSMQD